MFEIDLFISADADWRRLHTAKTLLKYHVTFSNRLICYDPRLFLSQIIIVEMITEIYFYIYIENCYYLTDYIYTTKFR
jgi:hypothetical protein